MYKILIKYKSVQNKIFWQSYEVADEEGNIVEFATDDFELLKEEIHKLDSQIGFENIKVVNDVTYSVTVDVVDDIENIQISTTEDIENIYDTAFVNIFGEVDNT